LLILFKLLSSPAGIVTERFYQAVPWKKSSGDCLQSQRDAIALWRGYATLRRPFLTMNLIRRGDSTRVTLNFFFPNVF